MQNMRDTFMNMLCVGKNKDMILQKFRRKRIAILGGAFDPPTLNHIMGATEVFHSGLADEIWIVPCGPRPDKPKLSSVHHRYVMCQLALNSSVSSEMPVHVSDLEVYEPEAMATYDMLSALRKKHADTDFAFVIGTDWLQPGTDIRTWDSKNFEKPGERIVTGHKLVEEFDFLVIQRPGYDVPDPKAFGPRMEWLGMPEGMSFMEGNLSSTEVRKRVALSLAQRKDTELIDGLVPQACHSYIIKNGCYAPEAAAPSTGKKLAIFRGSFDPPTMGHMIGLAEVITAGLADEVLVVPYGPKKDDTDSKVRMMMCQLAVYSHFGPNMPVKVWGKEALSDEFCQDEHEALQKLVAELKSAGYDDIVFVVSTSWFVRPPEKLQQLAQDFDFLVIKHPDPQYGGAQDKAPDLGARVKHVAVPSEMGKLSTSLSSSEVKKRAQKCYAEGRDGLPLVDGLVPPAVFNYMRREGVYMPKA